MTKQLKTFATNSKTFEFSHESPLKMKRETLGLTKLALSTPRLPDES